MQIGRHIIHSFQQPIPSHQHLQQDQPRPPQNSVHRLRGLKLISPGQKRFHDQLTKQYFHLRPPQLKNSQIVRQQQPQTC